MSHPRTTPMLMIAVIFVAHVSLAATPASVNAANTILFELGNPGTASALAGHFSGPFGVATDEAGNVYVLERYGLRIQKFDSRGNFLLQWGSGGSGNGQFNAPSFLAVDDGYVYVTDSGNNRVQRFTVNGVYDLQWGTFGTGDGQFNNPYAIAIDTWGDGSIYVSEWNGNRVQKFQGTGFFHTKWGSTGTGDGQFTNPSGIAVDRTGHVFVADQTNRMQRFTHEGNHMATWSTPVSNSNGIAIDAVGNLYAPEYSGHDMKSFSADGTLLETIGPALGSYAFGNPVGVAVDPGGDLYVTFLDRHTLLKLSTISAQVADAPPSSLMQSTIGVDPAPLTGNLIGAAISSGPGVVYVADEANDRILLFFNDAITPPGGHLGSPGSAPGQFSHPSGLALSPAGKLYVADANNHRIQRYSGSLADLAWGSFGSGNGQFKFPMGVAIDSVNNVYVADKGNNRVQKFDANGGFLMQWGGAGSLPGQFNEPMGIALDRSANVYVADASNHRIQKFTGNGVLMGQVRMTPNPGFGNGQFGRPVAVAVDAFGDVWVTDETNHRIQKFTQSGIYLTQVGSGPGGGADQFYLPKGLAVDQVGTVYVVDTPLRVQKFASPPEVTQVADVGADNGGFVRVSFRHSSAEMSLGWGPTPYQLVKRYTVYGGPSDVIVAPTGAADYTIVLPTVADMTRSELFAQPYSVVATLGNPDNGVERDLSSTSELGFSADQLPPPVPVTIPDGIVFGGGNVTLSWLPNPPHPTPDFSTFRVYRVHQSPLPAYTLVGSPSVNQLLTPWLAGSFYNVTAVDADLNESFFSEWINPNYALDVPDPAELAFALQGGWPNPASGRAMKVRFSLADAAPARLELIDVAGRVVAAREVGALGGGPQIVNLSDSARIRSGLYFIRLTQGTNSKTKRVTVLD